MEEDSLNLSLTLSLCPVVHFYVVIKYRVIMHLKNYVHTEQMKFLMTLVPNDTMICSVS